MRRLDFVIVVAYVAGCAVLGAWLGRKGGGVKDYFLGERDIPAWAVMISIVATETSAVTFLSVPGQAFRGDWTFLQLALGYIVARILVAAILLPSYFRGQIQTAYEVLAIRFGGSVRTAASILFLVSRTIGSGLRLFLAALVLKYITHWDIRITIVVIGASTIVYTYLGGLKGVVWADVLQFFVYLAAALVAVMILGREVNGGWPAIFHTARMMDPDKLRIFNFKPDFTLPYTFWAGMIGAMVLDMGSHGADHMMVQRYLSAKSQKQAAWALIASGFVILAQFTLFLMIGTGIFALYRQSPPVLPFGKDEVFASFIFSYFPTGLLGMVVAAVFSVTMSTVSGAISASASSSVNDLIRPMIPGASDRSMLQVSRGMTAFWGLAQIALAMGVIGMDRAVVDLALEVAAFVIGILLGLFLLGLWTKDVGASAALVGMVAGFAAVSYFKFRTKVAYPWYAPVGAGTVVLVGIIASRLIFDRKKRIVPEVLE